jgi:site-specific DNA-methyltransferase (adenine-specific)
MQGGDHFSIGSGEKTRGTTFQPSSGRWPANLIHDGSEEVTGLFPQSKGFSGGGTKGAGFRDEYVNGEKHGKELPAQIYNDSGSAARFFYCAKANKKDRNDGTEGLQEKCIKQDRSEETLHTNPVMSRLATKPQSNFHPTVKPTDLMRYLCRLVTPKGGTVLDPFMGSGSTGKAAKLEGFDFIGIELDPEYCKIAEARINAA